MAATVVLLCAETFCARLLESSSARPLVALSPRTAKATGLAGEVAVGAQSAGTTFTRRMQRTVELPVPTTTIILIALQAVAQPRNPARVLGEAGEVVVAARSAGTTSIRSLRQMVELLALTVTGTLTAKVGVAHSQWPARGTTLDMEAATSQGLRTSSARPTGTLFAHKTVAQGVVSATATSPARPVVARSLLTAPVSGVATEVATSLGHPTSVAEPTSTRGMQLTMVPVAHTATVPALVPRAAARSL